MSKSFKENVPELLTSGDTWGFFTTDSFGMVCSIEMPLAGKLTI